MNSARAGGVLVKGTDKILNMLTSLSGNLEGQFHFLVKYESFRQFTVQQRILFSPRHLENCLFKDEAKKKSSSALSVLHNILYS